MPMSDYETKVEPQTASGKVDRFSVRFSIAPAEPEEVAGVADSFTSKVHVRLSDSANGRLVTIPDLKIKIRINNILVSGELDFSNGEVDFDVADLKVGRNRISAEVMGFGVGVVTVVVITRKVIALRSLLPTKTDSYATGVGTIWTQVTPEKAGVQVTYTRDDSAWKQTEVTDVRGIAFCDGIVVTKPTLFRIVSPVVGITQEPETICIVPAPVGIPAWAKRWFGVCAIGFGIAIALLIFAAFALPETTQVVSDPVLARSLRAISNYEESGGVVSEAVRYITYLIQQLLWLCFSIAFAGTLVSSVACMWNATRAGYRNWRFRSSENRMGQSPIGAGQVGSTAPSTHGATGSTESTTANAVYKQLWEIGREIIAEAFVDAAARGVRSFKII